MHTHTHTGERYDFVINADQPVGAYWVQLRGLGECGIKRVQQLAILRYARGPYQPASAAPSYDVGIPQGVVSTRRMNHAHTLDILSRSARVQYATTYSAYTSHKANAVRAL